MSSSGRLFISADIQDGAIVNADVNAAAAILASKLAAGGTANMVVATADGTTMALQKIISAMITDSTILSDDMATGSTAGITQAVITTGNPTHSSASYATIPEMEITVNPTIAGSKVLVVARNTCTHSAANVLTIMALAQDGAAEAFAAVQSSPGTIGSFFSPLTFGIYAPTAASHTWRARWYTASGTITANAGDRAMFAIEFKKAG